MTQGEKKRIQWDCLGKPACVWGFLFLLAFFTPTLLSQNEGPVRGVLESRQNEGRGIISYVNPNMMIVMDLGAVMGFALPNWFQDCGVGITGPDENGRWVLQFEHYNCVGDYDNCTRECASHWAYGCGCRLTLIKNLLGDSISFFRNTTGDGWCTQPIHPYNACNDHGHTDEEPYCVGLEESTPFNFIGNVYGSVNLGLTGYSRYNTTFVDINPNDADQAGQLQNRNTLIGLMRPTTEGGLVIDQGVNKVEDIIPLVSNYFCSMNPLVSNCDPLPDDANPAEDLKYECRDNFVLLATHGFGNDLPRDAIAEMYSNTQVRTFVVGLGANDSYEDYINKAAYEGRTDANAPNGDLGLDGTDPFLNGPYDPDHEYAFFGEDIGSLKDAFGNIFSAI